MNKGEKKNLLLHILIGINVCMFILMGFILTKLSKVQSDNLVLVDKISKIEMNSTVSELNRSSVAEKLYSVSSKIDDVDREIAGLKKMLLDDSKSEENVPVMVNLEKLSEILGLDMNVLVGIAEELPGQKAGNEYYYDHQQIREMIKNGELSLVPKYLTPQMASEQIGGGVTVGDIYKFVNDKESGIPYEITDGYYRFPTKELLKWYEDFMKN